MDWVGLDVYWWDVGYLYGCYVVGTVSLLAKLLVIVCVKRWTALPFFCCWMEGNWSYPPVMLGFPVIGGGVFNGFATRSKCPHSLKQRPYPRYLAWVPCQQASSRQLRHALRKKYRSVNFFSNRRLHSNAFDYTDCRDLETRTNRRKLESTCSAYDLHITFYNT